jgi:hypothetical protein
MMNTIATKDGTQIYYNDWGAGPPVVFSHGWPLNADSWGSQMLFLASKGYRCIAHDRRGHGRSSQPWNGNEMDTYAAGGASAKIVENANLIVYSGAPHGITETHKDKLNADLLSFLTARDGMIPEA